MVIRKVLSATAAGAARGASPRARSNRVGGERRAAAARTRAPFARHARRLAEQHRQRQVDGPRAPQCGVVLDHQAPVVGGLTDARRTGSARARADASNACQPLGGDRQHVALLRLVAPQLQRRHARARRWGSARSANAAPRRLSWTSSGSAFDSPPAPTSWMETMGLSAPSAAAAIDHLLAAPLHLGVVALHRREIQVLVRRARRHRRRRAAAQADQHRRTAQHDERRAGRDLALRSRARRGRCRSRPRA